ncbi:MAG: hypothetical protein RL670_237 [Actinomycetota bacterium]
MTTRDELMQQRYGRRPADLRKRRKLVVALAAVLAVAFLAWAIAVNFLGGKGISVATDSYQVIDANHSSVKFTVANVSGGRVVCEIRAFNEGFQVVGYRTFFSPASGESTRSFETELNTTEQPVSVSVQNCQLK